MKKVIWITIIILVWAGVLYFAPLGYIQSKNIFPLEVFYTIILLTGFVLLGKITIEALEELNIKKRK